MVTDTYIGETVKLKLDDFAFGLTKIEGTLWDKKKQKQGTIKLIIDMKNDDSSSEDYTIEDGSKSEKKKTRSP